MTTEPDSIETAEPERPATSSNRLYAAEDWVIRSAESGLRALADRLDDFAQSRGGLVISITGFVCVMGYLIVDEMRKRLDPATMSVVGVFAMMILAIPVLWFFESKDGNPSRVSQFLAWLERRQERAHELEKERIAHERTIELERVKAELDRLRLATDWGYKLDERGMINQHELTQLIEKLKAQQKVSPTDAMRDMISALRPPKGSTNGQMPQMIPTSSAGVEPPRMRPSRKSSRGLSKGV